MRHPEPAPPEDEEGFAFEDEGVEGVVEALGPEPTEDQTISLLHEFGQPPEYRTMAKHTPEMIHLGAIVLTKGRFLGSTLREQVVENLFLMSRSTDGWGSEQMKEIAARQPGTRAGPIRRFFGLGRKEGQA